MEFCIIFAAYFENLLLMKKNINLLKKNSGYDWKFTNCGGVMRVDISTGQDIAHLAELDQKMWTVLSCPTKGLELDSKTLEMMDSDNDGRVRANEVIAASQWLTSVLNDPDLILRQEDYIPISAINTDNEEGMKIANSIRQILKNLGLEKDSISIADTADIMAIFNKTRFNGDGIITEGSTDDEKLKQLIHDCMEVVGTLDDRSGDPGVDTDKIELFFQQCADYKAWKEDGDARKNEVFPFGDDTEAGLHAYQALKDKIDDYFMRCKLASLNNDATGTLDVSATRIEAISEKSLTECMEEIAAYPLARIRTDKFLQLDAEVNPAWRDQFNTLKTFVFSKLNIADNLLDETTWKSIDAHFAAYIAWVAAKPAEDVEKLGADRIAAILADNQKDALMSLIEQDKALESEFNEISTVDKLLHFYRDFYRLLKNYITFVDFYDKNRKNKAIFQAGTLYIDQRCCDLCIKVSDMGKHNQMAGFSGMYLIYCECYSKQKNETMTIVAALTNGEVRDIVVGKNALFYDRDGVDWDAKIVKIIENPISIREAFWSPYRKFVRFIEDLINKFASKQDEKVTGDVTGKISETSQNLVPVQGEEKKSKQAFDIAKFCGIFAAIGLAIGAIGGFLTAAVKGFFLLAWWQIPIVILGIMLLISGPAMLMAWLKLRRRNLAPVLDANSWAVNANALISIPFGATLTSVASFPVVKVPDPFDNSKKTPTWKKVLWFIIILLVIAFCVLFFTNSLAKYGLPIR